MRIYKAKDYADMSRKAANIVSAQVIMKPNCVLGLATGSTPIGLYKQLVEWFRKGDLDFSEVMTVNLDEYKGLSRENDQSYYYFMHQNLFDHVNIPVENTHLPNGMEPDSEKECRRYTELIQSLGGVDLQLLGIGHNGHIGFNEPGESFDKQVLAIDRQNNRLDRFYNPHHEAVLRMIQMTVDGAHKHGKWVGICGELGADTTLTTRFVQMGIDELSVAPSMVLNVRSKICEME